MCSSGTYYRLAIGNNNVYFLYVNMHILFIYAGISTITANNNYYGIKKGSNLDISCILTGLHSNNSDYIEWEHDRRRARHKKTEVFVESPQGPAYVMSTLKIVNAKLYHDDGTFTCIGKEPFDNLQNSIIVKIHCKSHVIVIGARICYLLRTPLLLL